MLRRQPGEVARTVSAKKEPSLKQSLWPPMPATAPQVVQQQRKRVGQLEQTMKEICDAFGREVRQAFPGTLPELPNPGAGAIFGPVRGGRRLRLHPERAGERQPGAGERS